MRIAFIAPKGKVSNNQDFMDFWNKSDEIRPYRVHFTGASSGLLIMASLTPRTWKIEFIDENVETIDFNKSYDIVAISSMTQQSIRAYEIADVFRKKGVTIIMGGIHATVMPEEVKEHVDSVVVGEGEEIWPVILKDFLNGKLEPFYRSKRLSDLTRLPIPRYDLLNPKKYKAIWIQTSRGCPNDCEFCCASNIYGHKFRYKTIAQVEKELNNIINIWGRNILVSFADDNMFVNRNFSIKLINKIKDLKIRWFAQTDISVADDESFLEFLKKSGCAILFIGFESLNSKNLLSLNRNTKKEKYLNRYSEIIRKIQGYGIGVMGSFIVGMDEDNESVFTKTSDFIIRNNLFAAQITALTPLPGTRLRERILKENRLLSSNWDNYTFTNVNFQPKKMSTEKLEQGLLNVYKNVYSYDVRLEKARYFKKVFLDLKDKKK